MAKSTPYAGAQSGAAARVRDHQGLAPVRLRKRRLVAVHALAQGLLVEEEVGKRNGKADATDADARYRPTAATAHRPG